MQQNILLAARNSLKDGNALAQLNLFHPIRTFNELKAELGKRFSGQKLYEKIVEAAEANCKRESIGCFAAGTLVHTKDGLKPIQDIQVGDYVLSRSESGKEGVAYKRVVNTFRFENKAVCYVEYMTFNIKDEVVEHRGADYLIATPNHPFWVVGKTTIDGNKQVCDYYTLPLWKSVDQLDDEEIVVLSNGQQVKITGVGAIKKTKQNGIGWHQAQYLEAPWEDDGHLVNFSPENVTAELTFMSCAVFNEDAPRDKFEDYVDYESVVYNLEVEDYHTYFVGKMGVWVHNTNCGGSDASGTQNLTQEVGDAVKNKLSPTKLPGVHASAATFEKALPASKKAIGAFKELDILKWWAELQYRFDGSLSIAIDGVRTLYAYGLGFNNPFGGRSVNAMGDALAHIYKDGERIPSNTLVDTKAGIFGAYSEHIRRYTDSSIYDNLDFADKAKLDIRISEIVLKFKRDGAALAQYQGELNLTIAPQVSSDVLEKFIKKVALEDKWKTYHNAQFEVNGWKESDWLSENIFLGGLKSVNIEGQTRYVLDDQMKRIKKIYDDSGKLIDVQFESVSRDSVLKPLQGDNVGQSLLRNIYDWVKMSGLKFQTTQAHGMEDAQTFLSVNDASQLIHAAKAYWLQLGARAEILNAVSISVVSDLPSSVAATTEGAQIRLSANGAGWGWFLDETPAISEEFAHDDVLQNYKATQVSRADGKLDLLTVLIHEFGHVLGAQDLLRQEDVMSGALAPGVRRLPTAGDVESWLDAQRQRPIDSALSSGFAVRVAKTVPSGANASINSFNPSAPSSFSSSSTKRVVQGSESIATQQISLVEEPLVNSRASQTFTISERDRFLSFTISSIDLQSNSSADTPAPQDAFEVALLNANTGLPVLQPAGSANSGSANPSLASSTPASSPPETHSDALLSIQRASSRLDAALAEVAAAGVSHINNADGSRTYFVSLSGIPANTAVALSFDLIAFGQTQATTSSKVSIQDVRLLSTPLAVNDSVSTEEDSSVIINVQSNDLIGIAQTGGAQTGTSSGSTGSSASGLPDFSGFALELVSLAAHGQVSLLPDGTLRYTPDANYFGPDSFTYRYSDASATGQSDIATVSITVTPVNDAPTASDLSITTQEDIATTITLQASDIDTPADTLIYTITTQPRNGSLTRNPDGSYRYTPDANYFGPDSFSYSASDGNQISNSATVRINVTAVNDAPSAGNQSLSVAEDGSANGNLLASAADVEGTSLTARIIAAPTKGKVTLNANGTFSYKPSANFFGQDSFTYRVNDGGSASNSGIVRS